MIVEEEPATPDNKTTNATANAFTQGKTEQETVVGGIGFFYIL